MKRLLTFVFLATQLTALADTDRVSLVSARQRWPFSRLVDVSYTVSGATDPVDIRVAIMNGSETIPVPETAIEGQLYDVANGDHTLVIDPTRCGLVNRELLTAARFEVTVVDAPIYLIADLRKDSLLGDDPRLVYLTRGDIRTGNYGTYAEGDDVDWISNCSLPSKFVWTGVTNDVTYCTTNMVFRRVAAGACRTYNTLGLMSATNNLFITRPYYVAVFEFTEAQRRMLDDSGPTSSWCGGRKPYGNASYASYRGAVSETLDWPSTGHETVGGYALKLRNRIGLQADLLTAGQWILAYRAGTDTDYYLGTGNGTTVNGTNSVAHTIGRYQYNGGWSYDASGNFKWQWNTAAAMSDPATGWATPGLYLPNAYGLYDMAGSVDELVLDYYVAYSSKYGYTRIGTDPVGPTQAQSAELDSGKRDALGGSAWAGSGSLKATSTSSMLDGSASSSTTGTRFGIFIDHR